MGDSGVDTTLNESDIAIVGMAGRFPGAPTLEQFWLNLRNGVESITFFTDQELEQLGVDPVAIKAPNYVKAAPILDQIDCFDASFFGFTPRVAEAMDPQHRIFLECAWSALEHAGIDPSTYQGLIGVYAGVSLSTYLLFNLLSSQRLKATEDSFDVMIGNDKDFLSSGVSYKFNLRGPSLTVQTGCSSSLVSVHLACQDLLTYQCDAALAGGVSVSVPQRTGYYYQEGGIASPDGHCRAFDAQAQGSIFGSGAGVVILKRLADALADGDSIYAVVKGSAVNNDGSLKIGYTAPSIDGQADVIARAQTIAGVEAESITYIETHGTGTDLGDTAEFAALHKAFRASTEQRGFCAIGSVKTNIGHLDAAAGVAGLIKTVLALQHQQVPPSLHFERPNPKIDFQSSPFYVNAALADWKTSTTPRRAGVSSFGIGGTNAHVILEEAPQTSASSDSHPWQLLLISAHTSTALDAATAQLLEHLRRHPGLNPADVAYTLQIGRKPFSQRRMLVCQDLDDAVMALEDNDPQRVLFDSAEQICPPLAFLFPGLGDHYVHMASELYQSERVFRDHIDRCAELLRDQLGMDLRQVLYPAQEPGRSDPQQGDNEANRPNTTFDLRSMLAPRRQPLGTAAEDLNRTLICQPTLFAVEYALAQLWMSWGIQPTAMIGYSIGEYVAACLAGVFSLEDAIFLVARRAQLIDALPPGAMLAVYLTEQEIQPWLNADISLAAVNGPSLCVISGTVDAIEQVEHRLTAAGMTCRRVQTTHAFHSHMMRPIAQQFAAEVKRIRLHAPQIPYLSNVTGTWIREAEATDPHYWATHLCEAVRFGDDLHELFKEPNWILLEVGPGQSLSSFVHQHPRSAAVRCALPSVRQAYNHRSDRAFLLTTLGRLWLAGYPVDWPRLHTHEHRQRIPLPGYPFERKRYWIDPDSQYAIANAPTTQPAKNPDITDWFYIPSWKQTMRPAPRRVDVLAEQRRHWLIFVDSCDLGSQLVQQLEHYGQTVTSVRVGERFERIRAGAYAINPRQAADYTALLDDISVYGDLPTQIIHCWSVTSDTADPSGQRTFAAAQDVGFSSLLFLVQALAYDRQSANIQMWVITNHVQEVESSDQLRPEKATLLGLCKIIPQEYEHIACGCIDVRVPPTESSERQRLIDHLLVECCAPAPAPVVAYRGERRWVQVFEPTPIESGATSLRDLRKHGVYVITGGLGKIGLLLANYLARTVEARLVLVGRSALPDRQQWPDWLATHADDDDLSRKIRAVQAVEPLGGEVLVLQADVADPQQLRAVFDRGRARFGAIDGVIHAAGITGTKTVKLIPQIDEQESDAHFRAKVHGLYALEEVLTETPVDFCLLFSSNVSILGGIGAAAYAAANSFMDSFAAYRNQRPGSHWISANWDIWATPNPQLSDKTYQTSIDRYAMYPEESVEAFRRIVCMMTGSQSVVSTGDIASRLDIWVYRKGSAAAEPGAGDAGATIHPRPKLATMFVPPSDELEQAIAEVWQALLGIDQIGIYDNFFDLGGNSLIALKLMTHLNQKLNMDISVLSLFEGPTIHAFAKVIGHEQQQPAYDRSRSRGERRRERRQQIHQLTSEG